jgi:hypothetical protein
MADATLVITLDLPEDDAAKLVTDIVREQNSAVEVSYQDLPEIGYRFTILGEKTDLLKLQNAFKQAGYESTISD